MDKIVILHHHCPKLNESVNLGKFVKTIYKCNIENKNVTMKRPQSMFLSKCHGVLTMPEHPRETESDIIFCQVSASHTNKCVDLGK